MIIIDETFLYFIVDFWGFGGPPRAAQLSSTFCQSFSMLFERQPILSIIRERQTILSINYGN
jgi:hypothetical protein